MRVAVFGAVTALTLLPWIVHNAVVYGRFIPLSTNSGLMLIQSYSEDAEPNSGPSTDIDRYRDVATARGLDQYEKDQFLRDSAIDWIRRNPGPALRLYLLKVLNYFHFWNELATGSEESRIKMLVSFVTYYPLLLLALVRLLLRHRYPINRPEAFLLVLYFGNALLSAVFYPRLRYRIPFDFLLIAIAAAFLARSLDFPNRLARRDAAPAGVLTPNR
jgi:hypothetical protein